jgi:hypothetical protein
MSVVVWEMLAFGSPIAAQAIIPPLSTSSGFTPKKSRLPKQPDLPSFRLDRTDLVRNAVVIAGLIVYLAR